MNRDKYILRPKHAYELAFSYTYSLLFGVLLTTLFGRVLLRWFLYHRYDLRPNGH